MSGAGGRRRCRSCRRQCATTRAPRGLASTAALVPTSDGRMAVQHVSTGACTRHTGGEHAPRRDGPPSTAKGLRHKRDAARNVVGRPQRGSRPRARRAPRSLPPVFTWKLSHPTPASCWSPRPKLPWRRPPWSAWSGIDHNQVAVLRVHGRADPVLHLGRSTHGYGRRYDHTAVLEGPVSPHGTAYASRGGE